MSTVAFASKSPYPMKQKDAPPHAGKDKEKENRRRRSLSAFTLHSNTSFDHPKRRSFTSSRRSFSATFRLNEASSAAPHSSTGPDSGSHASSPVHTRDTDKLNLKTHTAAGKSRPASRFFSSPQFSSSTPNLTPKVAKYIDSELRVSHRPVQLDGVSLIIPTIVYKCCDFIRCNDPVEGLFRMNGSIKQVNLIESELQKNVDACEFADDPVTTVHDVAVVLKRWISKLDDGLITADVCNSLNQAHKELMLPDYPSEFEDADADADGELFLEAEDSLENIDQKLINMDQSFTLHSSPTKSTKSDIKSVLSTAAAAVSPLTRPRTTKPPTDTTITPTITTTTATPTFKDHLVLDSCYASSLSKLPIENLHLLLYLLSFLHYLAKPEISDITKMHTSNLAKVFQLNFFKSIDLTVGTKSFSTEDLKTSYLMNEELLASMIQNSETIVRDLTFFVNNHRDEMDHLLNVKPEQKQSNIALAKNRKSSSASTKTTNTASSVSRNTSIDSGAPASNIHATELSTTLESCEEKEVTPVPRNVTKGSRLDDLERLEKANEEREVIRTPNRNITEDQSEHKAKKDTSYVHTGAHPDNSEDNTRGSAAPKKDLPKKELAKRRSFFGFLNKWKQSIPSSDAWRSSSYAQTRAISPKEIPIASQNSSSSLQTSKFEDSASSLPQMSMSEEATEHDSVPENRALTVPTAVVEENNDSLQKNAVDSHWAINRGIETSTNKVKYDSQPSVSASTAADSSTATPPVTAVEEEKSEDIKEQLQRLDPSEENGQAIIIPFKRDKPKSSKANTEKIAQKRFSLFKFKRSS